MKFDRDFFRHAKEIAPVAAVLAITPIGYFYPEARHISILGTAILGNYENSKAIHDYLNSEKGHWKLVNRVRAFVGFEILFASAGASVGIALAGPDATTTGGAAGAIVGGLLERRHFQGQITNVP
jgi:hypothetical protein